MTPISRKAVPITSISAATKARCGQPAGPGARLTLRVRPTRLAVCRLAPDAPLPDWLGQIQLWSATRTENELSLVVPESLAPVTWQSRGGFRVLEVVGPLDFSLVGILADLTANLASVKISVLAISTYDTDLLLVQEIDLERCREALAGSGHSVVGG